MTNADCIVVMYHYVRDTEKTAYPEIKALSVKDFETQLDWLQENFEVMDYPAFEKAVLTGEKPDRPSALLTFDDGFIDHYETVLQIFQKRKITGVFFVAGQTVSKTPQLLNVHAIHFLLAKLGAEEFDRQVKAAVAERSMKTDERKREGLYRYDEKADVNIKRLLNYELPFDVADEILDALFRAHIGDPGAFAKTLYLSQAQITEMAKNGMTFGPHTETHRVLSRLSREEQEQELSAGAERIRHLTGQASVPFCYPYGHPHTYNADTMKILATTGHATAFNTVRAPVQFGKSTPFELERFDTKDLPPFTAGVPA